MLLLLLVSAAMMSPDEAAAGAGDATCSAPSGVYVMASCSAPEYAMSNCAGSVAARGCAGSAVTTVYASHHYHRVGFFERWRARRHARIARRHASYSHSYGYSCAGSAAYSTYAIPVQEVRCATCY